MPKTNLTKNAEAKKDNKEVVVPKATTSKKVENVEKVSADSVDELTLMKEELAKRDKEIADLKDMMLAFMAAQNQGKFNDTNNDEEEGYVYINNNSVGPVNFVLDSEGKSAYYIEAGIQGRPVSKEDMGLALKVGTMRKLFEIGVLEFVDKKNYKKYGIVQTFDLSEDHVLDILKPENIANNYSDLEQLIRVRKERTLEHELCYKALDLVDRGLLPRTEESPTIIYLNRLFCANKTTTFTNLLSGLEFKKGDWKK